ncbi:MAG: protein BatD [Bacteroidetes bacterium]|nr:protein BatD [Bacteroidota bacterium]
MIIKNLISRLRKSGQIVLTFALLFLGLSTQAAEISFTATVNRNPIGTNEQFSITFTINAQASNFQAPSFKDFNILSGPNQSTSMQFINGNMSQSVSFTYYLQAKSEGTFRIDPATIDVNGVKIKSNVLTLNVIKGQGKPQAGAAGSQSNDDDNGITTKSVFLRVSVDKSSVYRGEAILATYKLYTKVSLVNYTIDKLPALNGFWSQELKMPDQLELKTEVINGEQYRVGIVKKVILFPQQSGTLSIDPMQGSCIARVQNQRKRSNNPFDIFNDPFFNDPFFGMARDVKVNVKSEPVKITVKDLPPAPDDHFKGAVGNFTLQAALDKDQVKANDAINLKVKISGKGNLKLIDAPELKLPTDFETYDPKIDDNVSVSENGVNGSKTFEYLIIPRHEGDYTIDPIHFTFFDLNKKQYVQLSSSALKVTVKGISGDASAAQSVASYQNKTDVKLLGKDIAFIKTGTMTTFAHGTFFGSSLFYILLLIPIILLIVLIVYKKRQEKMSGDVAYMRSTRATKMAQKRLASAKKELDAGKTELFYEEIFKGLNGYASDKLGIDMADLSKETLAKKLAEKNISESLITKMINTIDTCELARFASQLQSVNPQQIYADSVSIITELENSLTA